MASHYDLAVLGGGVVGLSIAAQCAKRGWRVCLVDRSEIGKESSWAGAGILPAGATLRVDDPIEQLRQLSDQLHEEWARWLRDYTDIDTEYRRSGGFYLARSPAERATLRANCFWWQELGIEYRTLSSKDVSDMTSMIAPTEAPGQECEYYWVARDGKLRNPRHLAALKLACQKLGVDFQEHTEVVNLQATEAGIDFVECHRKPFENQKLQIVADRYCLTTGAWTAPLLKPLGIETGIYPVRGQMMEQLRSWALSVCPKLDGATLESQWSGLRPGSIDTYPYLGTLHPYKNGYIAAGHFRHGLHWSTATAVLMDQHMRGEPTAIDLEAFRVQRGNVRPS
ncbi:MAG: FAD-dependent oxidoreductase [Planctomycetaceae bacterium]|nr:FAD-dependent oxidoreductase [Planctomycetaceae bacterium]